MRPLIPIAIGLGILAAMLISGAAGAKSREDEDIGPEDIPPDLLPPGPSGPARMSNAEAQSLMVSARASANLSFIANIAQRLANGGREAEADLCRLAINTFIAGRDGGPPAKGPAQLELNQIGFTALANAL